MAENEKDTHTYDQSGQYDSGLKSLVRSLRLAFFTLLVLIIGMLIYFFTLGGYTEVKPQEAVLVLRFGKIEEAFTSGWHWYMPYPVSRFIAVRTSPQPLTVAFMPDPRVAEMGEEAMLEPGRDSYLITGDANIIHTAWGIQYQVTAPEKYYTRTLTPADPTAPDELEQDNGGYPGRRGPRTLLENLFRQAVIQVTAATPVDHILYSRKTEYQEAVSRSFSALVLAADCGVDVVNVSLTSAVAPAKTKQAFDEVAAANNTKETLVNEAVEYRSRLASEAQAAKVTILADAETYKQKTIADMKAQTRYFEAIQKAYQESPDTVLMALYNQTLSEVMTKQDGKYILGTVGGNQNRKQIRLKINPELRTKRDLANSEAL